MNKNDWRMSHPHERMKLNGGHRDHMAYARLDAELTVRFWRDQAIAAAQKREEGQAYIFVAVCVGLLVTATLLVLLMP
jgi:hypothetical protein